MQESWCELKKKKDFARRSFPQNSPSSVWLDMMFAALSAVSRLSDSATEQGGLGGVNSSSQLHKRCPFSGGRPSPVVAAAALQIHGALNVELSAQSATFSRVFLQLGWVFFLPPPLFSANRTPNNGPHRLHYASALMNQRCVIVVPTRTTAVAVNVVQVPVRRKLDRQQESSHLKTLFTPWMIM